MSQLPPPPPYPPGQPYNPMPPKKSNKALWIILAVVGGVIILCCGLGGILVLAADDDDSDGKGRDLDTQEAQPGSSESSSIEEDEEDLGEIVDSGFGQAPRSQYVWVTAVVHNLADHGGQTVTVNFNVLDKDGEILTSGSQVESFNVPDQMLAVGTQLDLGSAKAKAVSVEPTLLVEDNDYFEETDTDLGVFESDSIELEQYTDDVWKVKFTIPNDTDEALQSPRIGVVCWGPDGKINGGGSDYPELIGPGSKVVIEPYLITSGKPEKCKAYVASSSF